MNGGACTRVVDDYVAAVFARDVEAFMQLYDGDARVFDTWSAWSYEGAAARWPAIHAWFSALGEERVLVRFDDVQVRGGGEHASLTAVVTYAALSGEGIELRSMQNRLSWVLHAAGGRWRIVHEHTSVPVDADHLRAILKRSRLR